MKINFNQLDESKKQIQFTDGIYNLEINKGEKWMWTSQEFCGIVKNVNYISLTVMSDINNILYFDDNEVTIYSDCLNIIKFNVKDKSEFNIVLKDQHITPNDKRTLGVKILSISIDNELIF